MAKNRARPQIVHKPSRRLAPKRTLYIYCEGQFEEGYFEHLRSATRLPGELLKIKVVQLGQQGDARKMLEQARRELQRDEADPRDLILCLVFDCEPHDRARCEINRSVYTELVEATAPVKHEEKGFVSYPSFEVWPLLHRCENLKGINTAEAAKGRFKREFQQAPSPEFNFRSLTGQEQAMQRAEKIWRGITGFPSVPATSIHLLLALIEQLKTPAWMR